MKPLPPTALAFAIAFICAPTAAYGAPAAEPKRPAAPEAGANLREHAKAAQTRLASPLAPTVRKWISEEARKVAADPKTAVATDIRARFAGQPLTNMDVESLALLVMVEVSQDAEKDLADTMAQLKSANAKKAALRKDAAEPGQEQAAAKAAARKEAAAVKTPAKREPSKKGLDAETDKMKSDLDSKSELGETESLRLQMAMDRKSKFEETLSNLLKKASDTRAGITGNLK